MQESTSDQLLLSSKNLSRKSGELLKDGCVIALYARDQPALHVSRQRVKGGGWFLDAMSNVTKRDPAAQFLVVFRSKVWQKSFHFVFSICDMLHNPVLRNVFIWAHFLQDTVGLRSFAAGGKLLQVIHIIRRSSC